MQAGLAVADLLDLRGQIALVTGASGGLGAAVALRLAEAGAAVAVHYRSAAAQAAALVAQIQAGGGRATALAADLSDPAAAQALLAQASAALGPVDILVNNAADQSAAPLAELDLLAWRALLTVNLDAAFVLTQQLARTLIAHSAPGTVVNIASIEGLAPASGHAHYAASKAALLMFTRAAALEYGQHQIRVNAVSPGLIARPGIESAWPEGVTRWLANAPLARLGQPAEVADAVLFLASPAARWITGANLVVDGGMSTRIAQ